MAILSAGNGLSLGNWVTQPERGSSVHEGERETVAEPHIFLLPPFPYAETKEIQTE